MYEERDERDKRDEEPKNPGHCHHCNRDVNMVVVQDGIHLRGNCPRCGHWMKWIGKDVEPGDEIIFFGKHKGQKFSAIPLDYLRWLLDNAENKLRNRQRENLIKHIAERSGVTYE